MGAKRKAEHLDEFGPEDAKSQSPSKELPVTNSKTEESLKSKVDEIHKETYKKREEAYALLYRKDIEDMSSALNEKKIEYQEWARYQQETFKKAPKSGLIIKKGKTCLFDQEKLKNAALCDLSLVPIRLDVEQDGFKIRDTFTWNLHEKVVDHELFARGLCRDVGISKPSAGLIKQIVTSLKEQIDEYFQHAPALLQVQDSGRGNDGLDDGAKDLPELRTVIKLDITIDQQCIVDQFEWDIACTRNDPETFAELLVNDLGLMPEFKTAIAHSIREQIQAVSKSLLIANHNFTNDTIHDDQLAQLFLPPLRETKRYGKQYDDFGPNISQASVLDIEKMEKDLERESRRKRRQTQRSRRMTALPERETSKTTRTPLPHAVKFAPKDPNEKVDETCIHCKKNIKAINQVLCIHCAAHEAKHGYRPILDEEDFDKDDSDGDFRP